MFVIGVILDVDAEKKNKEICDFVHPHNAIITSIGPQHLDTFLSIEGVKKGKFELIEALEKTGIAVFASTNDLIKLIVNLINLLV